MISVYVLIVRFGLVMLLLPTVQCKPTGVKQHEQCQLPDSIPCENGSGCIPRKWHCDGKRDCADGSDETQCSAQVECGSDQFPCRHGKQCIPFTWRCDGENDCSDTSDEMGCAQKACKSTEFFCSEEQYCIAGSWKCDGERDCLNGSDEVDCPDRVRCNSTQFRCANSCIHLSWTCDGERDCLNGIDEVDCPDRMRCNSTQFRCDKSCFPLSWKCDGERDCLDGLDEVDCPDRVRCNSTQFRCDKSSCFPLSWKCDRRQDCLDGTDEAHCETVQCKSTEFLCKQENKCIPYFWLCDRRNNCIDGADEVGCDRPMRCDDTQFGCDNATRCLPLTWRCDGDKDCRDGSDEVGCIQTECAADKFLCDKARCQPRDWRCDGVEDCDDATDEIGCDSQTDVPTTTASQGTRQCYPSTEFGCNNGLCIHKNWRCDGEIDCVDGSDEVGCEDGTPGVIPTNMPTTVLAGTTSYLFRCDDGTAFIAMRQRCDGLAECADGSDEVGCEVRPHEVDDTDTSQMQCESSHTRCSDGSACIPRSWRCDGMEDCGDHSDELGCDSGRSTSTIVDVPATVAPRCNPPTEFQCNNGDCIHKSWR